MRYIIIFCRDIDMLYLLVLGLFKICKTCRQIPAFIPAQSYDEVKRYLEKYQSVGVLLALPEDESAAVQKQLEIDYPKVKALRLSENMELVRSAGFNKLRTVFDYPQTEKDFETIAAWFVITEWIGRQCGGYKVYTNESLRIGDIKRILRRQKSGGTT